MHLPLTGYPDFSVWLCLPKNLSGVTRGWAYGNEAADGRVFYPAATCYSVMVHGRACLEAENLVLRQQLIVLHRQRPKRVRLLNIDRLLMVWLYRL